MIIIIRIGTICHPKRIYLERIVFILNRLSYLYHRMNNRDFGDEGIRFYKQLVIVF